MQFHSKLEELKKYKGVSQKEIANAIGLSEQTLSYYFNGREPNFETLCKIADYFNVSLDYLLGREFSDNERLKKQNIQLVQENMQLKEKFKVIKKVLVEVEE